jgi:hypothetical protein
MQRAMRARKGHQVSLPGVATVGVIVTNSKYVELPVCTDFEFDYKDSLLSSRPTINGLINGFTLASHFRNTR